MAKLSDSAWEEIRILWMTTSISRREIAERYGITEGAIRKRDKSWGPRNAAAQKRAIVQSAAAGTRTGAQYAPRTAEGKAIQSAAERDIEVMEKAACVQVLILERCELVMGMTTEGDDGSMPTVLDPKDLRGIAEASRAAAETYRKVRGLDDPGAGPQETTPLERIADALAKKRAEAAACTKG